MSDELIGGRYRVIDCLRKTGFCETYVAHDMQLPGYPRCVVKKLQPQSNEEFVLETARRLFTNEANVLYRLSNHPQIPRLLAHLEVNEQFYLVQEFIEGKDLSQGEIHPNNRWSEEKVRSFLQEVLEILAFVHQHNVIHRDIKPSNLIRRVTDEKIVLIDFGAVKEISNMTLTEGQGNLLTVAIGTPGYMASEQQRGDPRFNSDIYALGITAIQAITGFHPDQLPRNPQTGEISWRERAGNCSNVLANILDKMVCNDFRERYQNVNEVLDDLRQQSLSKGGKKIKSPSEPNLVDPKKPARRWVWFAAIPLLLGLVFLGPRVWTVIKAMNYYNQGNLLNNEGKYEEAIDAFDQAIKIKPDFAEAWTNRGFAQGKLGRHLEKFSSCAQATSYQPKFAEAWNCRGLARSDLKQYEDALQEFNQALAVDQDFVNAWFNKGQVLIELDRYDEAITATRKALAIKPDLFLAWTQICRALYELQQYQDAKAHCEEARKIQPDHQTTVKLLELINSKLDNQ
ncbi:serine/threonine protein kinase [Stanieria cyanosphaera PCC 7437]|uniref:non-specific serine/threonine protein kinase n=1 Tax=Stanieria cyanosphaera (strain ATCC 29371 / PCC 7437) TaxID=111780 RepID=K9XYW3_STAC7|nr:serine/threonine-protein kinase [Stanieria cyanosphaera]AFZ37219.1 serine/threonine protein kinase [Stanieria cyanosphaera PCC 7437]